MKKTIIRITAVAALFVAPSIFGVQKLSAEQISLGLFKQDVTSTVETREGIVIGVSLTADLNIYLVKDVQTGTIYPYQIGGGQILNLAENDRVAYTVEKTATKIIIRDIVRK